MIKTVEPQRMPLTSAPLWPLSVAAYRALGEAGLIPQNTELLYGFVYRKMPKSPFHCYLLQKLLHLLLRAVTAKQLVRSEQPLTCGESEPEPDLAVVNGVIEDFRNDHPHTAELVLEICITSTDYDRSKLSAYAAAGVKECWLVLGEQQQVEIYQLSDLGTFDERISHGPGGKVTSRVVPAFSLDLAELFSK
jgi:Uma2 family endonuclease